MEHSGKYVTLVSAEGFEYVVDYEAACVSNMIKNLDLRGRLQRARVQQNQVPRDHGRHPREGVPVLLLQVAAHEQQEALPQFPLPPEMALELLMAANYLDV